MKLKGILLVVAGLSACVVAAPKKSQKPLCHPAEKRSNGSEATTKGFLILGENKFKKGTSPLIYLRNVQPVEGGLEVVTWDEEEIQDRGVRMQFLECDVPASKYAPPSKKPFKGLAKNTPVFTGQLATEDSRSCVTMKDDTISMEDCAKEDGDQLAAQWMHLVSNRVVYAGKAGSPLKAEVVMAGEKLKRFSDQGHKSSFEVIFLEDEPFGAGQAMKPFSAGNGPPMESKSSDRQSLSLLLTAIVCWVAIWAVV